MHKAAFSFLILIVVSLVVFGIVMLYSTSYTAFGETLMKKQLVWVGIGAAAALVLRFLDYRNLGHLSWLFLAGCAAALFYLAAAHLLYRSGVLSSGIIAHFPFISGPTKGSFRWLRLGRVGVQPSEFAKLAIILFLADYYNRRNRHLNEFWKGFLRPLLVAGSVLLLILFGKDLSTTAITAAVVFTIAFIAGVRLRYLIPVAAAGLTLVLGILHGDPETIGEIISRERVTRIISYRDPEAFQYEDGYQLWSSQLALGSGGSTGLGFTKSRMKQLYLPEAHTDFIVAIVGEELGFAGVIGLLSGYVLMVIASFWIAALAVDRTGLLLASGVGLSFGLHAFVNLSVVSGFCPTTGVTAPFVSYGGSSMIASLLGVGFLLSVLRVAEQTALQRETESSGHYQSTVPRRHAGPLHARTTRRAEVIR